MSSRENSLQPARDVLPEPVREVLNTAYWRTDVRPARFERSRIPFGKLEQVLRETQVRLRGWYFPHLTNRLEEVDRGPEYYGTWSNFRNYEYWRFYESAYLFHLRGVREEVDASWKQTLERDTRMHLDWQKPDWSKINGYLSIVNFLYTVTESFEFASRLANALDLIEPVEVGIRLNNISGFILTADASRSWDYEYRWDKPSLGRIWTPSADLIREDPAAVALDATVWFFQHFGWSEPNLTVLRSEQTAFLAKRA